MDKFPLITLHARKVSFTGMYNLVHVFSNIRSLTCWEPMFDIWDLSYFPHLRQLTLIRVRYSEPILSSIIHYFEHCKGAKQLEKICLEFIVQDQVSKVSSFKNLYSFIHSLIYLFPPAFFHEVVFIFYSISFKNIQT